MWLSQSLNPLVRGKGIGKEKAHGLKLNSGQLSGWIKLSSKSICVCVFVWYLGNTGYELRKSLEVSTQCENTVIFLLQDKLRTNIE